MRARIATYLTARRLDPIVPGPITRRLLKTPLGQRAMTKVFNKRADAKTTPRGH